MEGVRRWVQWRSVLVGVVVALLGAATVPAAAAAVGDALRLGKGNVADAQTVLKGAVGNANLRIWNLDGDGTALALKVAPGNPPFTVNSSKRVKGLNADKLDGKNSSDFLTKNQSTDIKSIAGSASWDTVTGAAVEVLASVNGFNVPNNGGVITATATQDLLADIDDPNFQGAFLWIEVDGTGACDGEPAMPGSGFWETITSPFASATAVAAAPVGAGDHRVDVCHFPLDIGATANSGKVVVEWVPVASGVGIAAASIDASTFEEAAAAYRSLVDR